MNYVFNLLADLKIKQKWNRMKIVEEEKKKMVSN